MNEWMNADYSVISSNAILLEQKRVFRWEKSSTLTRFFWDTYMTDMTSREDSNMRYKLTDMDCSVPYYPVRSSRSSALRCGLPSCMSVKTTIWKSRWPPLMVGRAISWRSHGKIGGLWTVYNWQHSCVWWFPWLPYLPSKTWHCFNPVCHRRIAYSVIIALWENQRKISQIFSVNKSNYPWALSVSSVLGTR